MLSSMHAVTVLARSSMLRQLRGRKADRGCLAMLLSRGRRSAVLRLLVLLVRLLVLRLLMLWLVRLLL